jgi:hypothetical protein
MSRPSSHISAGKDGRGIGSTVWRTSSAASSSAVRRKSGHFRRSTEPLFGDPTGLSIASNRHNPSISRAERCAACVSIDYRGCSLRVERIGITMAPFSASGRREKTSALRPFAGSGVHGSKRNFQCDCPVRIEIGRQLGPARIGRRVRPAELDLTVAPRCLGPPALLRAVVPWR